MRAEMEFYDTEIYESFTCWNWSDSYPVPESECRCIDEQLYAQMIGLDD